MNAFRIVLIIVLAALLAAFVGLPFYRDEGAPDQGAVTGTVVAPELPGSGVNGESEPVVGRVVPDPAAPLPRELVLQEPVVFAVAGKERPHGHVRAQAGIHVELVEERSDGVVVRLVNATVLIPRSAVSPREPVVLVDSAASAGLTQSARTAGRRIVDYWFPQGGR